MVRRRALGEELRPKPEPVATEAATFAGVAAEFLRRRSEGKPSHRETTRIVERELLPEWGRRPIEEITRRDAVELVDRIVDRGAPTMANRVQETASRVFSYALDSDLVAAHPFARMKPRGGSEAPRHRTFTDEEIRTLWARFEGAGLLHGAVARLSLLTGARQGEILGMAWERLDLRGGVWTLPKTKTGTPEEKPLTPGAVRLLREVPRRRGTDLVFPTNRGRKLGGWSRFWARVAEGIPDARFHDLHRTVRTRLSALGVDGDVAEMVFGHKLPGVRGVYDRHTYWNERLDALARWERELRRILSVGSRDLR